jgi:glycosyltransferase involved in cell wall biosynthesis
VEDDPRIDRLLDRLTGLSAPIPPTYEEPPFSEPPPPGADATARLEHKLEALLAEREELLRDRRTSLRAVAWDLRHRSRWWNVPRLGILGHHAPEPLRVPATYPRTRPPSPAPRISLVTPSYNQGGFLETTLRSVLDQGYPNLEYVVQDGGSEDETLEVLRRHEHQLARWEAAPDSGQADALNRGFAHTSGEIMAYLNSDDILLPGSLAYVARYLVRHPDVDAVYGQRVLIDVGDRQIGTWVMPRHDDEMLRWSDSIPQESLFWRRSAWDRAGGRMDTSFRFALDWDLLLRFIDSGARIVRLPRFLGAFRVHDEQKTQAHMELGEEESLRLRRRCHGREVPWDEAYSHLGPFLRRHLAYHTAYRAWARLPLPRVEVRFG